MTYAEGGTISYANGKRIHTFEDSGQLVVTEAGTVEALVVAGGGAGGGDYGNSGTAFGGGGGGGVIYTAALTVGLGNVAVVVGEGGISARSISGSITDAQDSSISDGNINFSTQTAIKGGTFGQDGGSGGGEGGGGGTTPGAGTVGQGNDGGAVTNFFTGGGGGGGADIPGWPAPAVDFTDDAGDGGNGLSYSISGEAHYYGAGGGGGAWQYGNGAGGLGGGGNGGKIGTEATHGSFYGAGGGGQGGSAGTGGNGYKGVVIFSYDSTFTTGRRVAQNEDLADMAASTIKGRITTTGIPQDLSASEVAGILAAHFQPLDSDLTAIAGLSPSNDDLIQRKAGTWVNRTVSQLVTDIRAVTDSVYGLQSGTLAQFAATTSLELKGVISDETGSGALVFANTPTLISPVISNFFWANHTHAASGVTGGTLASATGLPLTTGVTGILPAANGGTGINNSTRTLTISTNAGTISFSAAASTLTIPATGTAALLATANNFSAAQTVSNTTNATAPATGALIVSGGVAIAKDLWVGTNGADAFQVFNSGAGKVGDLRFAKDSVLVWLLRADSTAMSGANAGADMLLQARDDAGGIIGNVYSVTRSSRVFYFELTTDSTSSTTGAVKFAGGVGIAKALYVGTSILSVGATAGIGYATGAGGTVTQATNKATGVTLNKVTGLITMNNAALAADTTVTFTLTSSAIAATDTIILNHASAGTTGAYTLNAQVAAGSATINVRNVTAGSLSEAIVIRYTVIKSISA